MVTYRNRVAMAIGIVGCVVIVDFSDRPVDGFCFFGGNGMYVSGGNGTLAVIGLPQVGYPSAGTFLMQHQIVAGQ